MAQSNCKKSNMKLQMMKSISKLLALSSLLIATQQVAQASYLVQSQSQPQQQQMQSNNYNQQQQQSATSNTFMQQEQQQQQPTINPFFFNQNVQENQRAFAMCTTASGEMPVTFSWMKDNQLVTAQVAQQRRIQVKSDQDSSTLKISTVRLEHAGNYTCMAKNRFGSHLHTAQLVVLAEPRWLKEPPHNEPIVTTRGQTIVIDCQTIGYPKPQQTWHIKPHTPGSEFEQLALSVGANGRVSLASNGSLVIRNADKSDEANYVCRSSNGIGRGISWGTSLKVTVPAHFDALAKQQQQQPVIVRRSHQVQLRCDAYGDQPITIEWFRNRQPLALQQQPLGSAAAAADGPVLVAGDVRYSIHSNNNPLKNGLISQLLIKQAQRSDNSIYECVTKNAHGRDRLTMELVVQEEPDNIQELQLTQVSSRSVTLMWNEPYDGRSSITSYMFQYKRVSSSATDLNDLGGANPSDLLGGGGGDLQVQDHPTSHLHLHHLHQHAGGNNLPIVHQQQQQQHLKSAPAALDSDWQHATRISLPMPMQQQQQQTETSGQMGSVKSITIEKLEPSSRYVLRALAINSIGPSKFSQPMEFNTDEEAPEVGPVNIRAEPLNSTSIQVSWDEIPRSKHLGRIQGYYIGYRVANNNSAAANFIYKPYVINNDFNQQQQQQQSVSSSQQAGEQQQVQQQQQQQQQTLGSSRLGTAIHELRRDTVYEITVVAFNSRGSGPSSDFVVCKTIEMEAPKPVKLAIRRESNESIFIEWQRDLSDQNPVDDYVLYQEKNSASQEWLQVRLPGNQTQYKAPGLKCGTRYQFYITAHNKVGKSQPSEVVSASTSGALPVIPSKTSLIKMINSTCLLVNLNSFQDNGCRIKTFTVRYRVEKLVVQQALVAAASTAGELQVGGQQQIGGQINQQHQHHQVTTTSSSSSSTTTTTAAGNNNQQQQQQLVGSNGLSASHQALTAASQLGGKTVLAGQTASLSNGHQPSEWIAIRPKSNMKQQRANEEDRMEYLCDLSPVGEYTIHVAATNDVGRSEIEYSVLMSSDELRHSALKDLLELFSGLSNFFAYIPSMIVFLLAGLLLAIVSLILYTQAMKYYQKFIIMKNQLRATRRAKADEKRRRKLVNANLNSSRHSQKMAELWAEEYEDDIEDDLEDDLEDDDEQDDENNGGLNGVTRRAVNHGVDVDGDDEDDGTATTDELQSTSSSSANSLAAIHRRGGGGAMAKQRQRVTGRALARHHSHLSHHTLASTARHQHQRLQQQQQQQQLHQYSSSTLAHKRHSHYLANISNSAFDTSSIDSPCNKRTGGCLSDASTDSMSNNNNNTRFQCLNAKQYVKMNEYTMLPTISARLSPMANDIYGTVAMRQQAAAAAAAAAQHQQRQHASVSPANGQHQYRLTHGGSSPSGQSSSSASNNTASTTATASGNNSSSLYYSTLRRTNMQTYLPHQQQQQQQQRHQAQPAALSAAQLAARAAAGQQQQQQNLSDIYGYYMAPQSQPQQAPASQTAAATANQSTNGTMQQQQQQQQSASSSQVRTQAQQAQVAAAAAAAAVAAAQQAANEAANSIFVPPQHQIIYSAPNIRRQPPVFL